MRAANFGVTSNAVTAAAAIPAVFYEGPGKPVLIAGYRIRSAGSYDWASFPAAIAKGNVGIWDEPLARGFTPGRAALGIDHAAQSKDDFRIFLAGALVALGGGAILAAALEALHVRDWAELRAGARRRK